MRIAHIAYSVSNLDLSKDFFCENFGYRIKTNDPHQLVVLEPPEKPRKGKHHNSIRQFVGPFLPEGEFIDPEMFAEFHIPPDIILQKSTNASGLNHISFEVDDVKKVFDKFKKWGIVEGGCSSCRGFNSFTVKSRDVIGVGIEFFSKN